MAPLVIHVMNEQVTHPGPGLPAVAFERWPEWLVEGAFQGVDGAQVGDGLAGQDARQGARVDTGGEGDLPLRFPRVGKCGGETFGEGGGAGGVTGSVVDERSGGPGAVEREKAAGVLVATARRHGCHCARVRVIPTVSDALTSHHMLRTLNIWVWGNVVSVSVDATACTLLSPRCNP